MSNITPIRSPQPQWGGGWDGDQGNPGNPGWAWNGSQWVWAGGQPCPPQPCPPPQQVCCPPSGFSAVAGAQACYNQSQSLYNLVSQVVSDIFAKNPGIIPQPPPSAGSGPIIGVTDGSSAAPGEVGEFATGSGTMAYSGTASANVIGSISPLVLQPGDWDIGAYMTFTSPVGGAYYILQPVPPGASNPMQAWGTDVGAAGFGIEYEVLVGASARGSFSVPTLLAFYVVVGIDANANSGTAELVVSARRRR